VDNIKMDLGEMEWDGMDWSVLVQDREIWRALVKAVMNSRLYKILGSLEAAAKEAFSGVVHSL
jgi:hypothetical protein